MSWITNVSNFFKAIFSSKTSAAILAGIRRSLPLIELALQLAGVAASMTGAGRTINAVLAVAEHLGVPALIKPDVTDAELSAALRDIVANAIKMKFPGASTADINRAIEIALGALKS
jgi:hypothetical protein